jgi:predicted small secreted protein
MKKVTVLILAIFVLGMTFLPGCSCNTSPGDGTKVGQIVKMNKVGLLCKTNEAELIRGGFTDGSGAIGMAPFHFTVPDKMVDEVNGYLNSQTEVIITYDFEFFYWLCNSSSDGTFLTSIKPQHEKK